MAYSRRALCPTTALLLSFVSSYTTKAAMEVENLFIGGQVGLMPSGVGQMLPLQAYELAFDSINKNHEEHTPEASKFRRTPVPDSALLQKSQSQSFLSPNLSGDAAASNNARDLDE